MNYKLQFLPKALKEWKKLNNNIRQQLKKKLVKILKYPRIQANKLHGCDSLYKIKLRSSGYRLVYEVIDNKLCVLVITIAKWRLIYKPNLRYS
ncbi:MAG: type II toxin-antitoxin system RelE/ParE family toxin [Gammaproteobacteria bacterium]